MNNVLYDSPATTANAAVYNMGFIRAPISDNGKSLSMNVSTLDGSHHHIFIYIFLLKKYFYLKLKKTKDSFKNI